MKCWLHNPISLTKCLRITKKSLPGGVVSIYIFIDEVQYVENWEAVVKRYYDLYPKIKFFVSGSASLQIRKAK
jgi:predicted AAA+ superfamily ATPase